jgi:hypothetical protein
MPFEISYDPSLNNDAGYIEINKLSGEPLRDRDGQTLLYLLFWLLYTKDGRDLMRNNKPVNGVLDDVKRRVLTDKFASYGVIRPDLQSALIEAHIAAENWAQAFKTGPSKDDDRARAEKVYLQKMAFITWCLWEDAKGHEFSMGW